MEGEKGDRKEMRRDEIETDHQYSRSCQDLAVVEQDV